MPLRRKKRKAAKAAKAAAAAHVEAEGTEQGKPRRRGRKLLKLLALGGGVALLANEKVRGAISGAVGRGGDRDEPEAWTPPSPDEVSTG